MFIVVPMSKNRMFPLNFRENSINLANMEYKDISWLWHLRYGHLNFHSLKLLTLKELVYGFLKVEENNEVCEGCAKGKNGREKFLRGKERRAQYPLHLVHSYNFGPIQTKSLDNSLYFISFIDDYSRMCWVFFLRVRVFNI